MRVIEVVPYNPEWIIQYEQEASRLREVFGRELLSIHHIGSTSIPGIHAKPLIDIMPVVRDIVRVDTMTDAMSELGYIARGEADIPGRRLFIKPSFEQRTHHVHIYQPGNPEIQRHLDFRDFLAAHPEDARDYAKLKETLAARFRFDPDRYLEGKSEFIRSILVKAALWREKIGS